MSLPRMIPAAGNEMAAGRKVMVLGVVVLLGIRGAASNGADNVSGSIWVSVPLAHSSDPPPAVPTITGGAWTPVPAGVSTMAKVTVGQRPLEASPYYTDSPLFHGTALSAGPASMPTVFPSWPPPGTWSSAHGGTAPAGDPPLMTGANTDRPSPEPFIDPLAFPIGGQEWREYDISPYTSRFPASVRSDEAVRRWILRRTGNDAWHQGEVASLAVSSLRVRVYHEPRVQEEVADLLGRFLYYVPGRFRCRVRILSMSTLEWRQALERWLEPATPTRSPQEAWPLPAAGVSRLLAIVSDRGGAELAAPEFDVANGQDALVRWTAEGSPVDEVDLPEWSGVWVRVSPLIGIDAASIELDVESSVRQVESLVVRSVLARKEVPAPRQARQAARIQLLPGQQLLVSLGIVPDQRRRAGFGSDARRPVEIVVLIEVRAADENTVVASALAR